MRPLILGWDAAGVVTAAGTDVTEFKVGDEVFFAGDITRQGSYAEFVLVDEALVGHKPMSLSFEEAASYPLTALTAHEALNEALQSVQPHSNILIINGGGGVGSIAIQLAKLKSFTVIATASRDETRALCLAMGADYVLNHQNPLSAELKSIGIAQVDCILNCHDLSVQFIEQVECLKPLGTLVALANNGTCDLNRLMSKRLTLVWQSTFMRSKLNVNPEKQGQFLTTLAKMLDDKTLPFVAERITKRAVFSAQTLQAAHEALDKKTAYGKTVLIL
eukprot:TRINITY_DN3436_c0_g2_i3.p1 TRINITY_DN3436_c0_g2~~TRINITY_DN3436_c0_g2_i3.p1  ORF type:complete len:276 (-),score=77.74 TRINITY_DN3436_c0_g2_i3:14-841(-)